MLTWQELRQLSDAELDQKDLATINLACAVGLPGTEGAALDALIARLEEWTEGARAAQILLQPNGKSPEYCRVQRLVEFLRDTVRAAGSLPADKFLTDDQGADVLILDLLNGTSCSRSAFLVLCAAIGRRLGYPLKLLATKPEKFFYLFARWDDGKTGPFNIDVGEEGLCSRPDEYYRTGPHEVAACDHKRWRFLTALKPQEELAFFLGGRGFQWEARGDYRKALDAFAWGSAINTWNAGLRRILTLAIERWRAQFRPRFPRDFPKLSISTLARRYPLSLQYEQEQAIILCETLDMLLRDPRHEKQFWEPMRKGLPMAVRPAMIYVLHTPTGSEVKMTFKPGAPEGEQDQSAPSTNGPPSLVAEPPKPVDEGPLTIERLLRMSKEERARIDIAEMNLVCASGLPGTKDLDIPACLRAIAAWIEPIRDITERAVPRFESQPEVYNNSWATFRVVTMVLLLQRNLGMKYNEDRKKNLEGDDFFNRPEDIFIHGILSGNGGTCCSVPVLCVAVGRRLGYPLTLVSTSRHQFFRWDEPGGERINFEASSDLGLNTYPDDHYRNWPFPTTPEKEERNCYLLNKNAQGELSSFLMTRGLCWIGNGNYSKALKCFGWASFLNTDDNRIFCAVVEGLQEWREKLRPRFAKGLPRIYTQMPKRLWLNLPWEMETEIIQNSVTEDLLKEYRFKKLLDRVKKRGKLPAWAPQQIKVDYPDRLMFDI